MKVQPSLCNVDETLDIIVGKWKTIILLHLLYGGKKRFGELKRSIPSITQKMLTQHLRELEEHGLVQRIVYPEVPPRVEYSMTDYGMTLKPILFELHNWGTAHIARMSNKNM